MENLINSNILKAVGFLGIAGTVITFFASGGHMLDIDYVRSVAECVIPISIGLIVLGRIISRSRG